MVSRAIARPELQLFGALLLAVLLPMAVRIFIGDLPWSNHQLQQTSIAASLAVTVGFLLFRRLAVFPGAQASNYIWICLTATFGIALLLFFFLRIEYSRFQFAASYVLSMGWFYCWFMYIRRTQTFRFALVPGGATDLLTSIPGVDWVVLKSADTAPDLVGPACNGVVADLRGDFSDEWMRFITETAVAGTPVYHFKQIYEGLTGRIDIEHLSENTLGSLVPGRIYAKFKHAADWLAATAVLPLVVPFGPRRSARHPARLAGPGDLPADAHRFPGQAVHDVQVPHHDGPCGCRRRRT